LSLRAACAFAGLLGIALHGVAFGGGGISPECQQLANQYPEGFVEIEPLDEGFMQVWQTVHKCGWLGLSTTDGYEIKYNLAHSYQSQNKTCLTAGAHGSVALSWTHTWNVAGEISGSVASEVAAGVVLANAKASATVGVAISGGLSGSETFTQTFGFEINLPPCTAAQHMLYFAHGGAKASAPYVDLNIKCECVFGSCLGQSWELECGSTIIVVDVRGVEVSVTPEDAGWTILPTPSGCQDCTGGHGTGGSGGGGGSGSGGLGCLPAPTFLYIDPAGAPAVMTVRIVTAGLLDLFPDGLCEEWADYILDDTDPRVHIYALPVENE
jgi:hypothetical protein